MTLALFYVTMIRASNERESQSKRSVCVTFGKNLKAQQISDKDTFHGR